MACREVNVIEAIRVVLAAITAGGSYTNTLTGTGAVTVSALVVEQGQVPRVHIIGGTSSSTPAPSMRDRTRTLEIEIVGVAEPAAQTQQARGAAAYNLMSDLRLALEAALLADRLSGLVEDLMIDAIGVDGQEVGMGDVGVAHVSVTAIWSASIGGGAA